MDFSNTYSLIFILCNISVCICQLDDADELWQRTQLTSVVSFDSIDAFFTELYHSKFSVYRVPGELRIRSEGVQQLDRAAESLKMKKQICESIFSSDYFSDRHEKSVNPKSWSVSSDLKKNQDAIHKDLFKMTGSNRVYQNPFRERTVLIFGQPHEVFVFSCVVKAGKKKNYKQYFISEEFDLGAPLSRPIAGRFVFGRPDSGGEGLVIYAVAQEPAMSFTQKLKEGVEFFHFDKRLSSRMTSEDLDPICKLSTGERLRLCAALFSMEALRNKYKFVSSLESIQGECSSHPVSFKNGFVKRHSGEFVLHEWMFPCHPSYKNGKELIKNEFYVSRGYADDKVFLFRRYREEKMRLMYYFYNTGVVDAEIVEPHPPDMRNRGGQQAQTPQVQKHLVQDPPVQGGPAQDRLVQEGERVQEHPRVRRDTV